MILYLSLDGNLCGIDFNIIAQKRTKFKCYLGMSTHIKKENEKQDNSDNVI